MMQRIFFLGVLLMVSIFAVGQNNPDVRMNNYCEITLVSEDGTMLSQMNEQGSYWFSFHTGSFVDIGHIVLTENGVETAIDYRIINVTDGQVTYLLGEDGSEGTLFVKLDTIKRVRSQNGAVLTEIYYYWADAGHRYNTAP